MNGTYTYTPYILPMLAAAIIAAVVSIYSLRWRSKPGAVPLAMTCMFACVWAMGCVLEIAAVDAPTRIFWSKFQAIGKTPVVTAELCFVLEYADPGRWLNRRTLSLLFFPVLLALCLTVTNDVHHLIFTGFTTAEYPQPIPGIVNLALLGYFLLISGLQVVVLAGLAVRSPQHRLPVALMILGQVAARVAFLIDRTNASPAASMDPALIFAAVLFLLYALVLSRFHLFDLIPVGRATGIEQMETGLVVLDAQRRIVDLNPAAEKILSVSLGQLRGQSIQALPVYADLQARLDNRQMSPSDIVIGSGSEAQYYALHLSPLRDQRGALLGHNFLLYDVTEQKRARELVEQQQRAFATLEERERLARELHDSLSQELAFINVQAQATHELLLRSEPQQADEYVLQLALVARQAQVNARDLISGLMTFIAPEDGFLPPLRHFLDQFCRMYGIETELRVSDEQSIPALTPTIQVQLLRIIQEALTNVRKHARARHARLRLNTDAERVEVVIEDDGVGFDSAELGDESGHFGLRIMRERAAAIGGTLDLSSDPGKGTRVVVRFPIGG